jgi:DNA polymerase-3 subunit delta'
MKMYPWLLPAWSDFQTRLNSNKLAHAVMIHGPQGSGKAELAKLMLARLVCTEPGEFGCGQCRSCVLFSTGAHPDWFRLEPEEGKQQIVIEQVRSTIAALTLTSSFSPYKLAMIYPAESMNNSSANSLLKSLEEPPGDTIIILVSHDASRLPVTIRSRCQSIVVSLPEQEEAMSWLAENSGLDPDTAREALMVAGGSPINAVKIAEEGQVELHRRLLQQLSVLLGRPGMVSRVASELSDIEDVALWAWLSNGSADVLRAVLSGHLPDWLQSSQSEINQRALADLQRSADKNRLLMSTSVRQDLLLQDWLIKWSQLASPVMAT